METNRVKTFSDLAFPHLFEKLCTDPHYGPKVAEMAAKDSLLDFKDILPVFDKVSKTGSMMDRISVMRVVSQLFVKGGLEELFTSNFFAPCLEMLLWISRPDRPWTLGTLEPEMAIIFRSVFIYRHKLIQARLIKPFPEEAIPCGMNLPAFPVFKGFNIFKWQRAEFELNKHLGIPLHLNLRYIIQYSRFFQKRDFVTAVFEFAARWDDLEIIRYANAKLFTGEEIPDLEEWVYLTWAPHILAVALETNSNNVLNFMAPIFIAKGGKYPAYPLHPVEDYLLLERFLDLFPTIEFKESNLNTQWSVC